MVSLSPKVREQLSKMVVTCGEFKETVLRIFEALLVGHLEGRRRPKLSMFHPGSFDTMYDHFMKKFNEIKKMKHEKAKTGNDVVFDANEIQSLVDIFNRYVSNEAVQNSFPKRVEKTVNSIATLRSKKATGIKYDDLLKVIDWMRVDVGWLTVTAKKYGGLKNDAKNEVWRPDDSFVEMHRDLMKKVQEIWLNKFQANEKEKATFGSAEIKELISILQKYKGEKSPYKLSVVNEVIEILAQPLMFTNHDISLQYLDKVITEKLLPLYQMKESGASSAEFDCWYKLKEEADKWNDDDLFKLEQYRLFLKIYVDARNEISKKKVKILDEVMTIMQANATRNSCEITAYVGDWDKVKNPKDQEDFVKRIKKAYPGVCNAKKLEDLFDYFEKALGVYCIHVRNARANEIYEWLKRGLDNCCHRVVCELLFKKLVADKELQERENKILSKCMPNPSGYDISEIDKFVEQLKKAKF